MENNKGNKRYAALFELAERNGWAVDTSTIHHNGPTFEKGIKNLWRGDLGSSNPWICADLIDGHYCNHRRYVSADEAIRLEEMEDN